MVLRRREKKEQRREERDSRPPKEERPATPAPSPTGTLAGLRGTVRTLRPTGNREPYGIPWSNVTRFEPAFTNAGKEFGVDPFLMAAMAVVESDANHEWPNQPGRIIVRESDGYDNVPAVGMMQIKVKYWKHLLPDADPYDPVDNIRLATAIMAAAIKEHGSWEEAIKRVYFPGDDHGR